jgi:thiol-disulfide isomerase/thioredoxin
MRLFGSSLLVIVLCLSACSNEADYACALPPEIEAEFAALPPLGDLALGWDGRLGRRRELAARHPENLLVQLRLQETWSKTPWLSEEWDRELERYRSMSNRSYGKLLEANLLLDVEGQQSREMLQELLDQEPNNPWAHFAMIRWASLRNQHGPPLATRHIQEFRRLCPESIDVFAYTRSLADAELEKQTAEDGQRLLAGRTDDRALRTWPYVWDLMLDSDTEGTAATDEKIREQVEALAKLDMLDSRSWCSTVRGGYWRVSNSDAVQELEDRILAERPGSYTAYEIANRRWRQENGQSRVLSRDERREHTRRVYENAKSEHERWPNIRQPLRLMFSIGLRLKIPLAEKLGIIDEHLEAASRFPDMQIPLSQDKLQVAAFYLKEKVRLDRVPRLVNDWKREMEKGLKYQEPIRTRGNWLLENQGKNSVLLVMLEYYHLTDQPAKRDAMAAEIHAELDDRPSPGADRNEVSTYNRYLAGYLALAGRLNLPVHGFSPILSVEEVKRIPIEEFETTSVTGDLVRTADWRGRVTLVNVFATWCEDCRLQHQELQALHESLARDSVRAVVAVSVDEDPEVVRNYIRKNGFTFPVVVGWEHAEKISPSVDYPQNWLVDARGQRVIRQVKYASEEERLRLALVMDQLQALSVQARLR